MNEKKWKARLIDVIDSIDFVVTMMLLVFCMLGVFLTISFIAALIFGGRGTDKSSIMANCYFKSVYSVCDVGICYAEVS